MSTGVGSWSFKSWTRCEKRVAANQRRYVVVWPGPKEANWGDAIHIQPKLQKTFSLLSFQRGDNDFLSYCNYWGRRRVQPFGPAKCQAWGATKEDVPMRGAEVQMDGWQTERACQKKWWGPYVNNSPDIWTNNNLCLFLSLASFFNYRHFNVYFFISFHICVTCLMALLHFSCLSSIMYRGLYFVGKRLKGISGFCKGPRGEIRSHLIPVIGETEWRKLPGHAACSGRTQPQAFQKRVIRVPRGRLSWLIGSDGSIYLNVCAKFVFFKFHHSGGKRTDDGWSNNAKLQQSRSSLIGAQQPSTLSVCFRVPSSWPPSPFFSYRHVRQSVIASK